MKTPCEVGTSKNGDGFPADQACCTSSRPTDLTSTSTTTSTMTMVTQHNDNDGFTTTVVREGAHWFIAFLVGVFIALLCCGVGFCCFRSTERTNKWTEFGHTTQEKHVTLHSIANEESENLLRRR